MMTTEKFRIWVLEDNDEDFELLEMAAQQLPCLVDIERFVRGADFAEQLESLVRRPPKLIYLDLRMPRIGGIEVLEQLKSCEAFQCVPKLVFSTSTNPLEIAKVYQLGANAFHAKLIDTPKMLQLLKQTFSYWLLSVEGVEHVHNPRSDS